MIYRAVLIIVSKLPTPKSAVTVTSELSSAVVGSRQKPLPQPVAAFSTTEYRRPLVGNKTRRMAIANGTCVSFCNQPISKAYYLASRESRRYVVAGASIWLPQESLRYILASPGYAPGTFAVNVTWIERKFNA